MTEKDKADVRKIMEEELAKLPRVVYVPVYPVQPQLPPPNQPWYVPQVTCAGPYQVTTSTTTTA